MMEVCWLFPAIGTIENYLKLPEGEQMLYNHFALIKREEQAELAGAKLTKEIKGQFSKK